MAISSFFFCLNIIIIFFFARYMAISSPTTLHSLTLFLTVYCHYYYYFVTRIQSLLHLKSDHTGVILSPWTFQSSGRKRTKTRRKKIIGGHYVKKKHQFSILSGVFQIFSSGPSEFIASFLPCMNNFFTFSLLKKKRRRRSIMHREIEGSPELQNGCMGWNSMGPKIAEWIYTMANQVIRTVVCRAWNVNRSNATKSLFFSL